MRQKIFILLFGTLLALGIVFQISGKEHVLYSVSEETAFPTDISGLLNGEYQSALEDYLGNELTLKTWLVPIHNQLLYSVFHTSPNQYIVLGKNGNLYEEEYILYEEQYVAPMSNEAVAELTDKLSVLNELLTAQGKSLFIFITPSKASLYTEDIPYFDSIPFVRGLMGNTEYPVYPKTGIHWSRVTSTIAAGRLLAEMETQLGINFPDWEVSYVDTDNPIPPDCDLWELLNVMQKPEGPFYAPAITITDSTKDEVSLLARGGSFMGSSVYELINQKSFTDFVYMENTLLDHNGNLAYFTDYDKLPLAEWLDNADVILLEVNEEAIDRMSFGFIDYLLDNRLLQ